MAQERPRARIVSGAGRYSDPWHAFGETSAGLARVLEAEGWQTDVVPSEPAALRSLDALDLMVINCGIGDPDQPPAPDPAWTAAHAELEDWVRRGGPLLGTHTAAATFRDWAAWPELLGGQWVPGTSMHPPRGDAEVFPVPDASHPILRDLTVVRAHDERYSYLTVSEDVVPLLSHEHDGRNHVMAWARDAAGLRVVYDGLGHGPESYTSASRCQLLRQEVEWLAPEAGA